jgi:formylglycine-generating enzyme required for sulfatase activity/predicted ATPase
MLPVVTAAGQGDFGAVVTLVGVLGSVGGNLIANRIEAWRELSEEEVAAELTGKARDDTQWRDALDTLLEEFEATQVVQAGLSEGDRQWFAGVLRGELEKLGNLERYQAVLAGGGGGAIAQGAGAKGAGERGVVADTVKDSTIITGDHNRHVRAKTYIERQEVHVHDTSSLDPFHLRTAYLSRLFEQTGALSLAGVDPKAADESEAGLNLDAVYTALLTQTPEMQEKQEAMLPGSRPDREMHHLSALDQLNRHRRLVLLGDPGSGKSTFVNFVALCLAGEALQSKRANLALLTSPLPKEKDDKKERDKEIPQTWEHGALLPVRVVLRDFAARGLSAAGVRATADHLWCFIKSELQTAALADYAPHLHHELLHQGGLILLDGLDEVPEADRRRTQIKEAVEDFAAVFSRCRMLVTGRTYAYQKQDWRLANFEVTVLAPFSAGQIRRFVDRWYAHIAELRHLDTKDSQGRAELLKKAIFEGDRLRGLAERPLLLTLMASLHAWRGGSLPEKREELYADAVKLLIDRWESQRVVWDAQGNVVVIQPSLAEWLQVDKDKVRVFLNELAFAGHAAQPDLAGTADVPEGKLIQGFMLLSQNPDVKPQRLVEYLSQRAGLLVPRGVGVYTFPHRTFQEYLAACHLTDHDFPDRLAELARRDPGRWREVALLAAAKTTRGTAAAIWLLVEALCFWEPDDEHHDAADSWGALLAGQALLESANLDKVSERNEGKVDRVKSGLLHLMRGGELPALERVGAGRVLAGLGDPRPEVTTVEGMEFCFMPGGPFWMGNGDEQHLSHAVAHDCWIGRYPVTNAQYQAFIKAGGYGEKRFWAEAAEAGCWKNGHFKGRFDDDWRDAPFDFGAPFKLSNHPVVGVTWYEALAFTRWLTCYLCDMSLLSADWQIHLPSEAQWEKAARGGLRISAQPLFAGPGDLRLSSREGSLELQENTMAKRVYPWGEEEDANRANYDKTAINSTNAVGCFPSGVSPYGAEELAGNVWEWSRSLYKDYPYNPADGREKLDASSGERRVLRGGSFGSRFDQDVRCAYRYRNDPDYRHRYLGFRVVASPSTSGL